MPAMPAANTPTATAFGFGVPESDLLPQEPLHPHAGLPPLQAHMIAPFHPYRILTATRSA